MHSSVARRAAAATPGSGASPIPADPYAHLSEEQMAAMNEELRQAEEKYAPRFAEAEQIADENARRSKVEGLRNSFGTKQSMIRKKYGVRLRERRTKAEIQAERERLGLRRAEKDKERATATTSASAEAQPQLYHSSSLPSASAASRPAGATGSGWTAANTPKANATWGEHNAKRQRTDEAGGYQTPYKPVEAETTPTRKTLSVAEMRGGLSGSAATAAVHDPTLPPPPSQPTKVYQQSGAHVKIYEPSSQVPATQPPGDRTEAASGSATPVDSGPNGHSRRTSLQDRGSLDQPVVLDDDSSSGDEDEDIPSTLPAHVRKSLAPGGTSLLPSSGH